MKYEAMKYSNFHIAFLAICATVSFNCGRNVSTITPSEKNIVSSVYASGVVKARNQYNVYSKVSGIIKKIYVEENDTVVAGAPLMEIGNEALHLNTTNAELIAAFNAIYANREKINELKNNIRLAQSKYSIDSLNYCRQQYLFDRGIGTRHELEQRHLALVSSKTELESALHTYDSVIKQLRFLEQQTENNLQISKANEKEYVITSETNGRVYGMILQKGEMVNPTTLLAVIGDAHDFYVELEVDELDISKIQHEQKVAISLDAYGGQTFEGTVTRIHPVMNERSKTFTVEVNFLSKPARLYPLMTVEANIIIEQKNNALIIPRSYLLNDSSVICGSAIRHVTTGIKDYERVEITSGLSRSDVLTKPDR